MFRYADAIFRHRLLVLLPLVIIPALSAFGAVYSGTSYQVNANIWVDSSPQLASTSDYIPRLQPNQIEADTFNEWLGTKSFMGELIQKTGLHEPIVRGDWPRPSAWEERLVGLPVLGPQIRALALRHSADEDALLDQAMRELRKSIRAGTVGSHVLRVTYAGSDPETGVKLVDTALGIFRDRSTLSKAEQSKATLDFFQAQLKDHEKRLGTSADALRRYKEAHPSPLTGIRPGAEEQDLIELERQYTTERELYNAVLTRLEEARVAGALELQKRQSTLKVADAPEAPQIADVRTSTIVIFALVGLVAGLCLGLGAVVTLEWMSNTVRSSQDLLVARDVPVLATIPHLVASTYQVSGRKRADTVRRFVGGLAIDKTPTT